jgi:ABC-2 type transport system ATP-binding protein
VHVRLMRPDCRERARDLLAQALAAPVHLEADPTSLSARVDEPERVPNAMSELERADIPVAEFSLGQPSLDEVFLALTGRPAEDQTEEDAEELDKEEAAV